MEKNSLNNRPSRSKHLITTPGEADDIIERRCAALGLTLTEYVCSLIAYDCWAEKPHHLTGEACKIPAGKRQSPEEALLWAEIRADEGKPNKTGSYFEHRAAAFAATRPDLVEPRGEGNQEPGSNNQEPQR